METLVMNRPQSELRQEIGFLGTMLGDTIRETSGVEAFGIVEALRLASRSRRLGDDAAERRLHELVTGMDRTQLRIAIRAFTVLVDLLNLAEDRQRVQVLGERAREAYPHPRRESIRAAIAHWKEQGMSAERAQQLVDHLHVELVLTAHPTEAKRRSVRSKVREIGKLMQQYDADPLPEDRDRIEGEIRAEITRLWQTDFIRPWRPSVMQEVGRGLSIKPVLWETVPRITNDLKTALRESYGDEVALKRPFLTFGSWIGGDRDGHPGVTADVTTETLEWLRREAVAFHLRTCDALIVSMSLSTRQVDMDQSLLEHIERAKEQWPILSEQLGVSPPGEQCRQWLTVIRWRLEQTLAVDAGGEEFGAYQTACELNADVSVLEAACDSIPGSQHSLGELRDWKAQIAAFGLHLARLDVRQNAKVYREVLDEVFRQLGLCADYQGLDEAAKCELLESTLSKKLSISEEGASPQVLETLGMFRVLHRFTQRYSMSPVGAHVISMTSAASDVLAVLWLWHQTIGDDSESAPARHLPIVPLLETIDDLQHGPSILTAMLSIPVYRDYLRKLGDQQMIMLGYSDSTKDGGYVAACWSLHRTQQELASIAREHGIDLNFFHGRGGSLGRGGGPAARSILSLPEGAFAGRLRLTEQGEVLANRYDDPRIAYRHLEQVLWSTLLAAGEDPATDSKSWYETMDELSQASLSSYRELLENPSFIQYFRSATPISEIEQLPIGSRPSRRKPDGGLADLRAIPWVFSWTQSRCLIPAWYGIGAAMGPMVDDPSRIEVLRQMYQQWPFFSALVDNAELALAKSDMDIASRYAELASSDDSLKRIASQIQQEYVESCRAILALTQRKELLDGTPWLKESIRVRNRFTDLLNLIQIELMRRAQVGSASEEDAEELRHLTRLSINGIAAGLRTSG